MNKKTFTFATIAFSFIFLTSCDSERQQLTDVVSNSKIMVSKENLNNLDLKEKLEYKQHFLMQAVKEVEKNGLLNQEILAKAINSNVQKNTTTLKDLSLTSASAKEITNKSLSEAIEAFKGLENRDYNISFYVPFAEKLQTIRAANIITPKESIYIFEGIDNPQQKAYTGYTLNEHGNFVSYNELITEEMAEKMADNGRAVIVVGLQDSSLGSESSRAITSSATKKGFWISNLIVKDHKESWIGGASEIAIQMYKLENGNLQKINLINGTSIGGNPHFEFAKVNRRNVRKKRIAPIHSPFVAGSINTDPFVYNNSQFFYVVYEDDGWPTTKRKIAFPYQLPNGQQVNITFGSSDTEYYNSNTHNNKISSLIDNGAIKFNTNLQ